MKNEIVQFYGQSLVTARSDDGKEFVAMKPLCENLGLDWHAQRKRIIRDQVLNEGVVMMDSPAEKRAFGGSQSKMVFLPLEFLNGWLFGIDTTRLQNDATKERILVYKRECYRVLHEHWSRKSGGASLEERVRGLEVVMEQLAKSIATLSQGFGMLASAPRMQSTHTTFVTLDPTLGDNKRRKEEFIRSVIDVLSRFDEGISQTALFHRLEFSQTGQTRRWLHEGVGVWWDMYQIPGSGYRYIQKPEITAANA